MLENLVCGTSSVKKCNKSDISFPYSDLDKNMEERDGGERLTSG